MALSNVLAEAGHEPEPVRTTAKVHLEMGDDGPHIFESIAGDVGKRLIVRIRCPEKCDPVLIQKIHRFDMPSAA